MVAIDFKDSSQAAAAWAARHLVDEDGELLLCHVGDESGNDSANAMLEAMAAEQHPRRVRSIVRVGEPSETIVDAAAGHDVDLVVLGQNHDRSGLARVLGTTGASVASRTKVPVLFVRSSDVGPPRSLLVALHRSPALPSLLAWTQLFATRFSASVTAVHAVSAMTTLPISSSGIGVDSDRPLERLTEQTERWLEDAVGSLRPHVVSLTTKVALGDPATEIIETARHCEADLVILGRGGVGRVLGRLLGGITTRMLHGGDVALLIVPVATAGSG